MKKHFRSILPSILILATISFAAAAQVPVVVTARWLKENTGKSDLVVLHVSTIFRDYQNGHIPGARFMWPGWLSESTPDETTVPASLEQIKSKLEELGISGNSHVVLCGIYGNIIQVCRVFVMLEHIGMAGRISLLDGGMEDWQESGGEITSESSSYEKGQFNPAVKRNLVDAYWMAENLKKRDFCYIDTRAKSYYEGSTGSPRKGHIPGAVSLPSTDLFDGKTFKFHSPEKLKEMFVSLKIDEGVRPVFYCFSGNLASAGYVAARIAGLDPVLYDGSMEDWGSRFDLQVEK